MNNVDVYFQAFDIRMQYVQDPTKLSTTEKQWPCRVANLSMTVELVEILPEPLFTKR